MLVPPYLEKGDKIGIVSIASKVDRDKIVPAIELLEKSGFEVIIGEHTFGAFNQFAAKDEQRAADFQKMIDNPKIKAVICSRGGYGTFRALNYIDWNRFLKHPKWIVGFSDITVLHSKLEKLSVASLHGVMPGHFLKGNKPTKAFSLLLEALNGRPTIYKIKSHRLNRNGNAKGQLTGGNLSVLYSLRGTPLDVDTGGKILFIEDLGEYLYHLDRMMMNLKNGEKLSKLAGLIIGHFTGMKDGNTPFGKNAYEIIFGAVKEYNYPVVFDFPCGHIASNYPLKCGIEAEINVTNSKTTFKQN
jgi:muramoyltetrapeptide carboxypeptidase